MTICEDSNDMLSSCQRPGKMFILLLGVQDKGSNRTVICFWSPARSRRKGKETATISNQMCTLYLVLFGDVITVLHLHIMVIAASFYHYKTCEQRKLVILRISFSLSLSLCLLFQQRYYSLKIVHFLFLAHFFSDTHRNACRIYAK
jgi:hypothetical protein